MRAQFVFEKFEEETDPIKDMGIGIGNIDDLRFGSVLKAKHEFEIIDKNITNKNNNFLRRVWIPGTGASFDYKSIDKNRYIVVFQAQYENGILKVYYTKCSGGLAGVKKQLNYVKQHVTPEQRVSLADNFFITPQKNMNKYFEFISLDE